MKLSGRGLGGLAGGFAIKSLGSTLTFRIFASVAAATAVANELIHQLQRCSKRNPDDPEEVGIEMRTITANNNRNDLRLSAPSELEPLNEASNEDECETKNGDSNKSPGQVVMGRDS